MDSFNYEGALKSCQDYIFGNLGFGRYNESKFLTLLSYEDT